MVQRLQTIEYPLIGAANLRYYTEAKAQRDPLIAIELRSASSDWHRDGKRPFIWDFVPPVPERKYAVLRLAVARGVTLTVSKPPLPIVYDEKHPYLEVYRIQNPGLLSSDLRAVYPEQLQGRPLRWIEGIDPREAEALPWRFPKQRTAVIHPTPRGVHIFSEQGDWDFELIAPVEEPAAAVYDVTGPQLMHGFAIRVIRTRNTKMRLRLTRDIAKNLPPVTVLEHIIGRPEDAPSQGVYLDTSQIEFRRYEEYDQSLTGRSRAAVLISELGIGFIPVIGDLYDISQFAFASITGRNFWGEKVEEAELLMLGLTALLPIALGAVPAVLRASTRIAKASSRVARVLEPIVQAAVAARVDPRAIQSIRRLSEKEQYRLLDLAVAVAEGRTAIRVALESVTESLQRGFLDLTEEIRLHQVLVRDYEQVLAEPLVTDALRELGTQEKHAREVLRAYKAGALDSGQVLAVLPETVKVAMRDFDELASARRIFSSGFDKLLTEPLASGYAAYLARGNSASAVQWAIRQTRPPYRPALEQLLGTNYVQLINRLIQRGHIPLVDQAAKDFFNRVQGVIDFYRDHRKLTRGFGHLFEVDHLLEKRFFKSPKVEDVVDEADMFSLVVPKNPIVAREMLGAVGYAHSEKTRMLRELIPHGSEDLFTLQEWWDAHIFTFKRLGIPEDLIKARLESTFDDLKASVGQNINYRYDQTEELFTAAQRWGERGGTGLVTLPAGAITK